MFAQSVDRTEAKHGSMTISESMSDAINSPVLMLDNSSIAWHNNVTFLHYSFPYAVPNVWASKENVKNEQRAKLAKRAELPRVKLEYAPNCRVPIWHRVEVGRAELDCVKLARVKKDPHELVRTTCLHSRRHIEKIQCDLATDCFLSGFVVSIHRTLHRIISIDMK